MRPDAADTPQGKGPSWWSRRSPHLRALLVAVTIVLAPIVILGTPIALEIWQLRHANEFGDITVTACFPTDEKTGSLVVRGEIENKGEDAATYRFQVIAEQRPRKDDDNPSTAHFVAGGWVTTTDVAPGATAYWGERLSGNPLQPDTVTYELLTCRITDISRRP